MAIGNIQAKVWWTRRHQEVRKVDMRKGTSIVESIHLVASAVAWTVQSIPSPGEIDLVMHFRSQEQMEQQRELCQ